jgi:hypothetical protein
VLTHNWSLRGASFGGLTPYFFFSKLPSVGEYGGKRGVDLEHGGAPMQGAGRDRGIAKSTVDVISFKA